MSKSAPKLYVVAGPNGSGKTTFALKFLREEVHCIHFVNADLIAKGLSPLDPEQAALAASRIMLNQMKNFAKNHADFCLETTLSGRTYVRFFREMKKRGYSIHLFFLWVPSVEFAIQRVKDRVRQGGHHIPETVIRRRFHLGIQNLFRLYRPLLTTWTLIDNADSPKEIATEKNGRFKILDLVLFEKVKALL